jgi:hypothetical protein
VLLSGGKMNFLEHIGLATISGIIFRIVLGAVYIIYDEIRIKNQIKEERKNFYHMQCSRNPSNSAWVNKNYAQHFLDSGWEIIQ